MRKQILRPLQVRLSLGGRGFHLQIGRLRRADAGDLSFHERFVRIRLDLQEQVALFHWHPIRDRQFGDFPGHFRRDFYLRLRLDFSGGGDRLQDRLAHRLFGDDGDGLLAFPEDGGNDNPGNDQADDRENDVPFSP